MKPAYLFRNAVLYDGLGNPAHKGDLLIEGGLVTRVGEIPSPEIPETAEEVDLGGLSVAPGFINIHSHSDTGILLYPEAKTLLLQGITTEVVGNCGSSSTDTSRWTDEMWDRILTSTPVKEKWDGVRGYLLAVEKARPAVNVACLFGHGDLRRRIVGDSGRPLSDEERRRMEDLARTHMAEGAFGVSSGLEYVPGRFADLDELSAISTGVASYRGLHASHIRNEGPGFLEAVEEAIAVARQSGVRFEIAHIKACGPDNWGKVKKALAMLDEANAQGIDISADFYPYLASSTELAIVLPDWVLEDGKEAGVEVLKEAETRDRAAREAHLRTSSQGGWDKVVITGVTRPENKWMEGKDVSYIAEVLKKPPEEAAIDILIDEKMHVRIARFAMSEEDLIEAMRHPRTCVVTDGWNTIPEEGKTHPRCVGTFPRVLGYYARERGVISMEEAVRKMTSLPARKLGLKRRGVLAPGYAADLVIFDRDKIIDRATFENPWQYPEGIFAVFVNGEPCVWEGEITRNRPGMVLMRG